MAALTKGQRVTGADRQQLAKDLKKQYESGASIRELAAETNRSYGFIHRVLKDEGAKLRGRGGATRGPAKKAPAKKTTAKKSTATTAAKKSTAATAKKAPAKSTAKTTAKKTAKK